MRSPVLPLLCWSLLGLAPTAAADDFPAGGNDEQTLQAAGLTTDGPALLDFFRARARTAADRDRLRDLMRRFAGPAGTDRAKATAELTALGPLAIPTLRHAANDLSNADLALRARRCLRWLEGSASAELTTAAARLLAARKPAGAATVLLDYLPFADGEEVAKEVTTALAAVALPGGKADPALLKALADPVPARRAAACTALCKSAPPGECPDVRRLLTDPSPAVRVRAAMALAEARDAAAVPVLIELLAELPAAQRLPVEEFLQDLAGEWAPTAGARGEDEVTRHIRRDAWAAWWRNADGPALLALLRKRTLTGSDRDRVQGLIRDLGAEAFEVRERATTQLAGLGPMAVPLLRQALQGKDLEVCRRAERCLGLIEKDPAHRLPPAALRLLALRRPAGAAAAVLAYLPFAEDETLAAEAQAALTALALPGGKPEPALVRALADGSVLVRAAAAEALVKGAAAECRPSVRKLLADGDPSVRLRVAVALAAVQERAAVPVLIDLLAVLPADQSEPALTALNQLAGDQAPTLSPGADAAARRKCRDAWAAWWKANEAKADLAKLTAGERFLGYTLIIQGANAGRVTEVDRAGKVRWEVTGLNYPVDAWVLPGNRVLVAEYSGNRVTERDLKGAVVWQKDGLGMPLNVQRLANGHTFIATMNRLLEVDRTGKEVLSVGGVGPFTAACKARNGHVICLTQAGQCLRLDAAGKQLKSFPSNRQAGWTSGLDLLRNGHILITQPDRAKVAEYDADGKLVLEFDAPQVTTATGLPNGHILAASANTGRAWEVDRKGKVVWEYKGGNHVFRARRR